MIRINDATSEDKKTRAPACEQCKNLDELGFDFEFAYQPIVNVATRTVFAHEALVRGPNGESAYSILSKVNDDNRYAVDQACRVKAVKTAAELGMQELLSIIFTECRLST